MIEFLRLPGLLSTLSTKFVQILEGRPLYFVQVCRVSLHETKRSLSRHCAFVAHRNGALPSGSGAGVEVVEICCSGSLRLLGVEVAPPDESILDHTLKCRPELQGT